MKIEVYVQHIFQEYPVTESIGGLSFDGDWRKYERNCGCRGNVALVPIDISRSAIQRVFLRPEAFGGLMYDPSSGIIFRLDREGFEVMQDLQQNAEVDSIRKSPNAVQIIMEHHRCNEEDLLKFLAVLRDHFLW